MLGRRQKTKWLHLDPAEFTLELVARYESSEIDQPNSPAAKSSSYTFEEALSASTTGYVVHPNLVELNLAGKFGVSQRFFEGDTLDATTPAAAERTDSQYDTIAAWDARATFLRNQTAPFSLYTTRSQQYISRDFGPTLESTTTTYGLFWNINLKKVPMTLRIERREEDQDDFTGLQAFSITQNTVEWGGAYNIAEAQTLSWSYTFNDVSQSSPTVPDTDFNTHDATLSYNHDFGDKKQNTLYSTLQYRNQSGDFALEQFRFDNFLRLRHTDRFETEYTYAYSQYDIDPSERTTHRGTAKFRHRLYDSLVTTGQVGAELNDFGDAGAQGQIYLGSLSFDYTKKAPLGRFSADLTLAANYQLDDARTETLFIVDERHTFTDPRGIVLTRQRIAPNSIRVTDLAGIVTFRPGIDYDVIPFDTRTEIRRIPTGLIPPGSTVLLDYAVLPEPESTTTTTAIAGGVRYDFTDGPLTGLAVYGRFLFQDQTIDSSREDFFVPDDVTDFLAGAEYRLHGLTLTAEQRWHDSEIDPYDSTLFSARYSRRFRQNTTLSATAAWTSINYQDPDNTVDLLTFSADLEHRFSRSFDAKLTLLYRNENDDLLGDTTGFEQLLNLTWKHRQTEIYVLLRNAMYETEAQDSEFQYFQIGFRRRF